jgi:hypothetical protein
MLNLHGTTAYESFAHWDSSSPCRNPLGSYLLPTHPKENELHGDSAISNNRNINSAHQTYLLTHGDV